MKLDKNHLVSGKESGQSASSWIPLQLIPLYVSNLLLQFIISDEPEFFGNFFWIYFLSIKLFLNVKTIENVW